MPEFYLPPYLRSIVKRYWSDTENLSLRITKFIPFGEEKRGSSVYKPKINEFGNRIGIISKKVLKDYEQYYNLQKSLWISKLKEYGINSREFLEDLVLKTKSRLIIGLGDESVYETSVRLHRNYGLPYIPGSALKGVTKHYAIMNLADRLMQNGYDFFKLAKKIQNALETTVTNEYNEEAVEKAIKDKLSGIKVSDEILNELKLLRKMFGTQSYEGTIIFFDAFPTPECLAERDRKPILELDVMNPHYAPYYSASERELQMNVEKAPGDWHQPIPIFFLTVPEGVEFQFAIAPRNEEGIELLNRAKSLLVLALKEFGVGAKTSLGYGRFE